MSDTVKYLFDETRIPKDWYNIVADLPRPPDPVLHPGTLQPVGPADLATAVSDGADPAGGDSGAHGRDPRAGPRRLPPVAAVATLSRPPPRRGARYPGQDLLQIRGRQPGRQPEAQYRRGAGLLQQGGGRPPAHHGDRGRTMGLALAFAGALFGLKCGSTWSGSASPTRNPTARR